MRRKEIPDVHSKAHPAPVSVSLFLLKPLALATVPEAPEFSEALQSRFQCWPDTPLMI